MYHLQVNCSSVQYINKDWCCDCASGRAHSTMSFLLLKKISLWTPSPACSWRQCVWENGFLQNQVALLDSRSWGSVTLRWLFSLLPTNVPSWSRVTAMSPHLECAPFSALRKAYRQLLGNCSSWLVFWNPASFAFAKTDTYRHWDKSTGPASAVLLGQGLRLGTGSILQLGCAQGTRGNPSSVSACV